VTRVLQADAAAIREAAAILKRGGLIAFPTETVYGLGADAENEAAMRALFAAKGRPADHPVIVHLAHAALMDQFAAQVPEAARKLAIALWPGPMTLVLRRSARISKLVTAGLETVGLRVPAHPVAQALLKGFGGPIAAPSANRFGRVSCTRAEHVVAELGERVDLILDGGECNVGLESTIIDVSGLDVSGERPAILRPGAVTAEQVANVLVDLPARRASSGTNPPRVPGSLPSHYAPQARVELVAAGEVVSRARQLAAQGQRVAVIGPASLGSLGSRIELLTAPENNDALAHSLYSLLRQADELGCDAVVASVPAEDGVGAAIADRLRRAAGPRDCPPASQND
jgi:L-threonylcarbamoyladenylate synthase